MGERFVNRVSKSKRMRLRTLQNNKCIYCNLELPENGVRTELGETSVEHMVPQAVFKWTQELVDKTEETRRKCNSINNLALAHSKCNMVKNSEIPTEQSIETLNVSEELKDRYKKALSKNKKYIEIYNHLKTELLVTQNYRCGLCGRYMKNSNKINEMTIRRKDNSLPRTKDNAILICFYCNMKNSNTKKGRALK